MYSSTYEQCITNTISWTQCVRLDFLIHNVHTDCKCICILFNAINRHFVFALNSL